MVRTTPGNGIALGDTRGAPINRKTTKTYIVTLIRKKRRIGKRNRGRTPQEGCTFDGGDLLVSLQGSPGAKVENGGFECWTSFAVERAQLPV